MGFLGLGILGVDGLALGIKVEGSKIPLMGKSSRAAEKEIKEHLYTVILFIYREPINLFVTNVPDPDSKIMMSFLSTVMHPRK